MFATTRGLYGLCAADKLPPAIYFNRPYIAGIALRATWAELQPTAKRWNTAVLDESIARCKQHLVPFTLNVLCGDKTPAWVKGPRIDGVPIPWEPAYQAALARLVAYLGEEYGGDSLLAHVKTTGVNERGGELQLPEDMTNGADSKVLADAVIDTVDLWANAFPARVELVLPVQPRGIPKDAFYKATEAIIMQHGSRLVFASHALSARWVNPYVAQYASSGMGAIGFQMVSAIAGDTAYRANGGVKAKAPEILRKALDNGINAGASYIEVYLKDAESAQMQKVLQHAAERLAGV